MPVTPTYPGVYIEEIPSGVRTIVGVATSITAFIDYFTRGPMNKAVQILSLADFERQFGGLNRKSEASYAIQQYFLNGGQEAWVVRVASGTDDHPLEFATVGISSAGESSSALTVKAKSEGDWGNNLQVMVDNLNTAANEFNLTISEVVTNGATTRIIRQETFRNLSMDSAKTNFVDRVINNENSGSKMVTVTASGSNPPLANGTTSGDLSEFSGLPTNAPEKPAIQVTIDSESQPVTLAKKPSNLFEARTLLESAIRAAAPEKRAFTGASVSIVNNRLNIRTEGSMTETKIVFAKNDDETTAEDLKLTTNAADDADKANVNVQTYTLGRAAVSDSAQVAGIAGANGEEPDGTALIGDENGKTGIYALEEVDLFNILCIPRTAIVSSVGGNALDANGAAAVLSRAIAYCEKRRAVFIVDTPNDINEVQPIKDWLSDANIRNKNATLYFPRVRIADPLDDFRLRSIGASGTMAGLYARTDTQRGVWKAPAGTEATLTGVQALDYTLTDSENGTLNPLAINCLRSFPVYGKVGWGARTLRGADQLADEWKYIPVRRTALYIEESLYRGLQWVVFEPNDEPLWAQIRLNVGAFMHNLFRQGAFQGTTPRDAYFVKCDKETTTQNDINLGIVNVVVGFAPLKPAEFVIIKLQQMAGQIEV